MGLIETSLAIIPGAGYPYLLLFCNFVFITKSMNSEYNLTNSRCNQIHDDDSSSSLPLKRAKSNRWHSETAEVGRALGGEGSHIYRQSRRRRAGAQDRSRQLRRESERGWKCCLFEGSRSCHADQHQR